MIRRRDYLLCGSGAILKACNATVAAGQNQPYWIDISVPHGATNSPSGIYTGSISITADQGSATIPVTLTVWNFELPVQPSELSLWTLWSPRRREYRNDAGASPDAQQSHGLVRCGRETLPPT